MSGDPRRAQVVYGTKVAAVEPGGVEMIPLSERHGRPVRLLWTWVSPNMEFATVTVGLLAVLYFGLTFWQAVVAIVAGSFLGSVTQGVLSTWGPRDGLPQMVLSRTAFGFAGNYLPAGINALTAGIGWFAVNSISGALALHALAHVPKELSLLIVVVVQLVVAFFGYNLVELFERYAFPLLTAVFVVASVIVLSKAHPSLPALGGGPPPVGGFFLTMSATFGYAAGWNPYASDYTRYLAPDTPALPVGLWAGAGVFLSCVFLEIAGAAVVTAAADPARTPVDPVALTGLLPNALGKLTLLAICIGAIAANVLNVYSGAMSFLSLGLRLPLRQARAAVAAVFAVVGFVVASFGLRNAGTAYQNFLLIIAYWIAPWLGVVFVDRWLRRGQPRGALAQDPSHSNWAGPIAMAVAGGVAIWLFSNQTKYVGVIPSRHPAVGDITPEVGFALAGALYLTLQKALGRRHTAAAVPAAV